MRVITNKHAQRHSSRPTTGEPQQPEQTPPKDSLLRLPPELRNTIYEMVFTSCAFGCGTVEMTNKPKNRQAHSVLSILQTCKTINKDAQGMFYNLSILGFSTALRGRGEPSPGIAQRIQSLVRTLSLPRLHAIRRISLASVKLEVLTAALKKMTKLVNLEVVVFFFPVRHRSHSSTGLDDCDSERRLLKEASRSLPAKLKKIEIRATEFCPISGSVPLIPTSILGRKVQEIQDELDALLEDRGQRALMEG